jgi:hypothetical protein
MATTTELALLALRIYSTPSAITSVGKHGVRVCLLSVEYAKPLNLASIMTIAGVFVA